MNEMGRFIYFLANDERVQPPVSNVTPEQQAEGGLHDAACSAIFEDIAPALNCALNMKGIGAAMAHFDDVSSTLVLDIQGCSIEILVFHGNPPRCHVLVGEDGRAAEFIRVYNIDQERTFKGVDVVGGNTKFHHTAPKKRSVREILRSDDKIESLLGDAGVGIDPADGVAPVFHGNILQNVERMHSYQRERTSIAGWGL